MAGTLRLSTLIRPGEPAVRVIPAYHRSNGRHDHDFYELVYVTEGYCLHKVEELSTLLMEGDCFIVPPGVGHAYSGNRDTRIYNCIFDESAILPWLQQLQELPGLGGLFVPEQRRQVSRLRLSLSERKSFLKWISSMEELGRTRPLGWQIRLPCELACLLVEYSRACAARGTAGESESPYPAYVRQALSIIDADYGDCTLSVHGIAERVGVSDDYLTRQFKQAIGLSTQEYLRRFRFARAMSLLQTDRSVAQVAQQTGFRTLSYFSREFTKELGISPSKYRDQINQN